MWCVWKCSNRYPSIFTNEIEVRDTGEESINDACLLVEMLASDHAKMIGATVHAQTDRRFSFTTSNGTHVWYEVRRVAGS